MIVEILLAVACTFIIEELIHESGSPRIYRRSVWVTIDNLASERIMTLFNVDWVGCSTSICFEITLCQRIINAVLINRIIVIRAMLMLGFDQRVDVCAIESRRTMVIEV